MPVETYSPPTPPPYPPPDCLTSQRSDINDSYTINRRISYQTKSSYQQPMKESSVKKDISKKLGGSCKLGNEDLRKLHASVLNQIKNGLAFPLRNVSSKLKNYSTSENTNGINPGSENSEQHYTKTHGSADVVNDNQEARSNDTGIKTIRQHQQYDQQTNNNNNNQIWSQEEAKNEKSHGQASSKIRFSVIPRSSYQSPPLRSDSISPPLPPPPDLDSEEVIPEMKESIIHSSKLSNTTPTIRQSRPGISKRAVITNVSPVRNTYNHEKPIENIPKKPNVSSPIAKVVPRKINQWSNPRHDATTPVSLYGSANSATNGCYPSAIAKNSTGSISNSAINRGASLCRDSFKGYQQSIKQSTCSVNSSPGIKSYKSPLPSVKFPSPMKSVSSEQHFPSIYLGKLNKANDFDKSAFSSPPSYKINNNYPISTRQNFSPSPEPQCSEFSGCSNEIASNNSCDYHQRMSHQAKCQTLNKHNANQCSNSPRRNSVQQQTKFDDGAIANSNCYSDCAQTRNDGVCTCSVHCCNMRHQQQGDAFGRNDTLWKSGHTGSRPNIIPNSFDDDCFNSTNNEQTIQENIQQNNDHQSNTMNRSTIQRSNTHIPPHKYTGSMMYLGLRNNTKSSSNNLGPFNAGKYSDSNDSFLEKLSRDQAVETELIRPASPVTGYGLTRSKSTSNKCHFVKNSTLHIHRDSSLSRGGECDSCTDSNRSLQSLNSNYGTIWREPMNQCPIHGKLKYGESEKDLLGNFWNSPIKSSGPSSGQINSMKSPKTGYHTMHRTNHLPVKSKSNHATPSPNHYERSVEESQFVYRPMGSANQLDNFSETEDNDYQSRNKSTFYKKTFDSKRSDNSECPSDTERGQKTLKLPDDFSKIPGFTVITSNLPDWKKQLLERRNSEAIDSYLLKLSSEQAEKNKYTGLPQWKANLLRRRESQKSVTKTSNHSFIPAQMNNTTNGTMMNNWKGSSLSNSPKTQAYHQIYQSDTEDFVEGYKLNEGESNSRNQPYQMNEQGPRRGCLVHNHIH